MSQRPPVLLIDDDEGITFSIATFLEAKGYAVTVTNSGSEGLRFASAAQFPLILADIYIDRVTGLDILKAAKQATSKCAVILMTAKGSVRTTVEAEAEGVFDYLPKPIDLSRLLEVLERAERSLAAEDAPASGSYFRRRDGRRDAGHGRVVQEHRAGGANGRHGADPRGNRQRERVGGARHSRASTRAQQPFVPVDCAAIPENLWESELFGSTRGAFTSAEKDRAGIVEQARGGPFFLTRLERFQFPFRRSCSVFSKRRSIVRLARPQQRQSNARIVAATHRPLEAMLEAGEFRADLYHRLNVLHIPVPALRERAQDIPLLADRFPLRGQSSPSQARPIGAGSHEGARSTRMARQCPGVEERHRAHGRDVFPGAAWGS